MLLTTTATRSPGPASRLQQANRRDVTTGIRLESLGTARCSIWTEGELGLLQTQAETLSPIFAKLRDVQFRARKMESFFFSNAIAVRYDGGVDV
jgi:hypothetical protein